MPKIVLTILKVLLSIGLAVVILYLVFKQIDIQEFKEKAKEVNYFWVVLSMFISLFGYILRAYRWKLQLEPLDHAPTTYRMFLAVMSGYLANLLLPRLGEITRCGVLLKSDKVPIATSFGTVVTERIVDVLMLCLILLFTMLIQSDQLAQFFDQTLDTKFNGYLIFGVGSVVVGLGLWLFFKFIYPSKTKVGEFSRGLVQGLISLRRVHISKYVISTLLIWIIYYFMSYLVFFAVPETSHLTWEVGFSILVAGVVAFVLPVQSGFGTFHALVSTMLLLYSIDKTTGIFFATLLHSSQLIAVMIFGLIAGILSIFVKNNEHKIQN
ncbi:MAG: flippase-like domain-containing protein [Cytophagales bacterium]|nr:flippase-like domain-containing protein [Cytophagales bacterium]